MPGLIAFRRRWGSGSDDFVVPSFLLCLLHIILFAVIAILISTSRELDELTQYNLASLQREVPVNYDLIEKVKCATEIRNFSFGYLVLIAVSSVIEMVLTCYSMRGTILTPEARRPVEYIFYARIGFGVIEMTFSTVTSVMFGLHWSECEVVSQLNHLLIGIIVINAVVFVIVLIVGCCVFDPAGGKYYKVLTAEDRISTSRSTMEQIRNDFYEKSRKTWFNRVSNCFCCVSNNQNNVKQVSLDEVSTLLYNFFKDYDFVPSDIVAGLTLLRHRQQCIESKTAQSVGNDIEEFMCGRPITPRTVFADLSNERTKKECEDLAYYSAYSLAAYGPLFFWMENTGTGVCQMLAECLCAKDPTCSSPCCVRRRLSRNRKAIVRSDTGCGWVHAGIRKSLAEHGVRADIVYISLENEIYRQPFYLAVDHERKCVVVAIRGTVGDEDALTDMVANAELIRTPQNDGTWKAHKGMLRGAEFVKSKLLQEDMVLSLGFGHCLAKGTRHYNLIIVGHSLGAGIATILAILLHSIYPRLRCYAYSPPGGLLSRSAVVASKPYVHTLILGKDVVPRLGIPQLECLRNEVVGLLRRTDLPKYKIILSSMCGSLKHKPRLSQEGEEAGANTTGSNLIPQICPADSDPLYLPGVIHHIVYKNEIVPGCRSSERKKYYIVYGDNFSDFRRIIVSHKMISHHLPHNVWKCANEATKCNPTDRDSERCYAQADTLPFDEKASVAPNNRQLYQGTSLSSQTDTLPHLVQTGEDDDAVSETSDIVLAPSMNANRNNAAAGVPSSPSVSSSSSDYSMSSVPDARAPLARPESFSLSSSAQSPTSPFAPTVYVQHTRLDVVSDHDLVTERLLKPDRQGSSTFQSASKSSTLHATSSHSLGRTVAENYDSSLYCDDMNVDLHGTNGVG